MGSAVQPEHSLLPQELCVGFALAVYGQKAITKLMLGSFKALPHACNDPVGGGGRFASLTFQGFACLSKHAAASSQSRRALVF